jgi:hypothetical protein
MSTTLSADDVDIQEGAHFFVPGYERCAPLTAELTYDRTDLVASLGAGLDELRIRAPRLGCNLVTDPSVDFHLDSQLMRVAGYAWTARSPQVAAARLRLKDLFRSMGAVAP